MRNGFPDYKDGPERIVSRDVAMELLSTGTVVGGEMVIRAASVLREGGYMLVDEVEQSLNKSLVAVFLGLFTSPATNPHVAQLVFTTHYTQVLDNLRREDVMVRDFITRPEIEALTLAREGAYDAWHKYRRKGRQITTRQGVLPSSRCTSAICTIYAEHAVG